MDQRSEQLRSKEVTLKFSGKTEASLRHPERNEDAIYFDPKANLAMVLDGVGGGPSGERASRLALEIIKDHLSELKVGDSIEDAMLKAFYKATSKVATNLPGAGTTAVVAKIIEFGDRKRAVIGSVGDSRVYLLSENRLEQITEDDSLIPPKSSKKLNNVTKEEELGDDAVWFNQRNVITQCIGVPIDNPYFYTIDLKNGDKLILTSDGVHDNLTSREIEHVAVNSSNIAEDLVQRAKGRSAVSKEENIRAKADDISAVVVEVD